MIRLICFDLDGVLVDSKETHFNALNLALKEINEKFIISVDEHVKIYDGLPTNEKLKILTSRKGLSPSDYNKIWTRKQEITFQLIDKETSFNEKLNSLFRKLHDKGIKIHCCSNSIKKTIRLYLTRLGIIEFIDEIVSNEDIRNPKPHPEIYMFSMTKEHMSPEETLVIEDSHVGLTSAIKSGASKRL